MISMIQAMTMKEEIASACVAVGSRGSGANHNAIGTAREKKQPISFRVEVNEYFVSPIRFAVGSGTVIGIFFRFRAANAEFNPRTIGVCPSRDGGASLSRLMPPQRSWSNLG